jgi:hypothetical protein
MNRIAKMLDEKLQTLVELRLSLQAQSQCHCTGRRKSLTIQSD